jgi:penicillin-binding protein 2A
MAKAKKSIKKKNRWLMLVISFMVCLMLSVIGGYFSLLYAGAEMIDESKLEDMKKDPSVVYDKDGQPIYTLNASETRDYIPYNKIPKHLIEAFVAVEDKRFFEHNGIDMIRIAGAILKDIQSGSAKEGGSTITQQLARNVFLSQEKTFWRKTKEVSIAINLERNYTKEQIMEMYLNKIYMGEGVFGVEAASKVYFGKSLTDQKKPLTLAEAAALAAIPKAPSYYSPFADPAKAKERRDTILRLMYEQKYITLEQKEKAQAEPMPVDSGHHASKNNSQYRAYIDYVLREAKERYGIEENMLYRGGWKIYTSMDKKMQDAMISAFANPKNFPKDGPTHQVLAGMVALDPKTGGIVAMMGGRNYTPKGYNYAVDIKRQPGSSFKPLVAYAPALDSGEWSIYSKLSNQQQDFNGYKPRNYNNKYSEHVTMYEALINSMNVPTVWLLNKIGINTGIEYAEKFGIELDPEDRNLAIALGGLHTGTSPLKMAQAYSTFANGGIMSEAHAITRIQEEQLGYLEAEVKQTPVLKPQAAWDMHTLLRAAVEKGTGKAARMDRPVAGKTGTTQSGISKRSSDNKDVWFVGYTPEYVGAIWMGFEKEDSQHLLRNGSDIPAKLFKKVFSEGLKGRKVVEFEPPEGAREPEKKEETQPLQLAADLTMENNQLKVVLSWIGGEGGQYTYDVYRFHESVESRELIASSLTDMVFVDSINEPLPYKYIVVPRDEQGNEGIPSNVAEINMSQLENLLQDGAQHNDENLPPDGELPPTEGTEEGTTEQTDNPEDQEQPAPEDGSAPPDIPAEGDSGEGTDDQPPGIELPIPGREGPADAGAGNG